MALERGIHDGFVEQERGLRRGGPRRGSFRPARPRRSGQAAWRRTRWRSARSFGKRFFRDYLRRRHRRHRRPGFDGWVANLDGLPLYYRRSLWGGLVVDEPPEIVPPQDEPPGEPNDEPSGSTPDDADGIAPPVPDQEITRSYRATLDWSGPVVLPAALARADGGIYVVEKHGAPVYVGEAGSFRRRWLMRLEVLRQLDADLAPYRLRLARIVQADRPYAGAAGSRLREAVEHTLIRGLARQGLRLTNRTSTLPFAVGSITLTHTGSRPRYVLNAPVPVAGQAYEDFGFA